jgi:hypothetical protein
MEQRAGTYATLFFRSLQLKDVFPDSDTVRVVILRHTDAQLLQLARLTGTCLQFTDSG